jgi:hypothetical protein
VVLKDNNLKILTDNEIKKNFFITHRIEEVYYFNNLDNVNFINQKICFNKILSHRFIYLF